MNIYPVIHYKDHATTILETAVAKASGAAGVFLITHHNNEYELIKSAEATIQRYKDFKIGINLLHADINDSVAIIKDIGASMAWYDNIGIDSQGYGIVAKDIISELNSSNIEVFAGVAFKYQKFESEPGVAAQNAIRLGAIPTTSGPGTGRPADIKKLENIRAALEPNDRLAIASGVTPENISIYKKYSTDILVATGIALNDYNINPELLDKLIKNANS